MISDRICRPNAELSRSKQSKRLFVDLIVRMPAAWLLAAALLIPSIAVGEDSRKTLKSGWYPWDPYQYLLVKNDLKRLTGLDVQLVRAVFAQMGYDVDYEEVSWKQHQLDLQNGVRDIRLERSRTMSEPNTPTTRRLTGKRPMSYMSAKERRPNIHLKTLLILRGGFSSNRFV